MAKINNSFLLLCALILRLGWLGNCLVPPHLQLGSKKRGLPLTSSSDPKWMTLHSTQGHLVSPQRASQAQATPMWREVWLTLAISKKEVPLYCFLCSLVKLIQPEIQPLLEAYFLPPTPGCQEPHWVRDSKGYRCHRWKGFLKPGHFWGHGMTLIKCVFWNSFQWLWRSLAVPPYRNLVTSKNEHFGGLHWESLCVLHALNHHIWAPFLAIYLTPQQIPMECPSFHAQIGSCLFPLPLLSPSL